MALLNQVVKAWGLFEQELAQARKHYSSTVMARVFSSLPFIFEGALDRPAPGSGSQVIKGQNHAFDGGRPISRNMVFSGDVGHGADNASSRVGLHFIDITTGLGVTWHDIHSQAGAPFQDVPWEFQGYVSPGIDTALSNANDLSPCGLVCYTIVVINQPLAVGNVSFRWQNVTPNASQILTSGRESSVIVRNPGISATDTFFDETFTDLPCIGAAYNRFNFQILANVRTQVWLMSVVCTETRQRSAPNSAGTLNLRNEAF